MREGVFARDRGCRLAGSSAGPCLGRLTFHHLRKAGRGGAYAPWNGLALCAHHNDWIEENRPTAATWGLVVGNGEHYVEAWARMHLAGVVWWWWDGSSCDRQDPITRATEEP